MNYLEQQKSPWRNLPGLTVVVLLHIVLIYALVNGLGSSIIEKLNPPIATKIIQDTKPPPPPQDYIPPPEVVVQQPPPPQTHAIQAVQQTAKPVYVQHAAPAPAAVPDQSVSTARVIGGLSKPETPDGYDDRAGRVTVDCVIEPDGYPQNCKIVNSAGGQAFATSTLRWLNGSDRPRYHPAIQGGKPVAQEHAWSITFQPAE